MTYFEGITFLWTLSIILISNGVIGTNETCDLTKCSTLLISKLPHIQLQVKQAIANPKYDLVRLRFSVNDPTILGTMKANGQADTFDPVAWALVSRRGKSILQMPYDYRWASLGLLTLGETTVDIPFIVGNGVTCLKKLSGKCRDQVLLALLKSVLATTPIPASAYLCRAAYTHLSFKNDHDVTGISMKCCDEDDMATSATTGTTCEKDFNKDKHDYRGTLLAFSIIFSSLFYITHVGWQRFALLHLALRGRSWDWLGRYFGFGNNCYHAYILRGKTGQPQHWIQLSDEELMGGRAYVTLSELWITLGGTHRSGRIIPVLRCLFLTMVVNIVAFYIVPNYYNQKDAETNLMQTGDEIGFNLRSIPISWWTLNSNHWTEVFAIVTLVGVEVNFAIDLVVSMIFCCGFREKPVKGSPLKWLGNSEQGWRKFRAKLRRTSGQAISLALLITLVHLALCFCMVCGIAYAICNITMYVAVAILYHADVLLPWLFAVIMLLYYTYDTYQDVKKPYHEVRNILFDEYLNTDTFIVAHTFEDHYKFLKEYAKKKNTNVDDIWGGKPEKVSHKKLITLRAIFHRSRKPKILFDHFLDVSDHLVDKGKVIGSALIKILLLYLYGLLVVFTITAYLPVDDQSNTTLDGLIASIILLMFMILPLIGKIEICRRNRTINIRVTQWKFEIRRYLNSLSGEYDSTPSPRRLKKLDVPVFGRRQREQVDVWLDSNEYFFEGNIF